MNVLNVPTIQCGLTGGGCRSESLPTCLPVCLHLQPITSKSTDRKQERSERSGHKHSHTHTHAAHQDTFHEVHLRWCLFRDIEPNTFEKGGSKWHVHWCEKTFSPLAGKGVRKKKEKKHRNATGIRVWQDGQERRFPLKSSNRRLKLTPYAIPPCQTLKSHPDMENTDPRQKPGILKPVGIIPVKPPLPVSPSAGQVLFLYSRLLPK